MKNVAILFGVCIAAIIIIQIALFSSQGVSFPFPNWFGEPAATIDQSSLMKTEGNKVVSGTAENVDEVDVQVALRFRSNDTVSVFSNEVQVVDGRWSLTIPEDKLSCNEYEVNVFVPVKGTPHQVKRIAAGVFNGTCTYILSR
ncbi:MAG: hypothetical protein KBC38_00460 [Candidatus Pacebacteria bacterium]|nr:hypothetical protein [Candidatus Paceibacterota bacterium]MBP9840468.1 hypothetical protein [Candidatus Paceibacterota bacterium]